MYLLYSRDAAELSEAGRFTAMLHLMNLCTYLLKKNVNILRIWFLFKEGSLIIGFFWEPVSHLSTCVF